MTNPLAKFYRIPGLNTTLPSKGLHQPKGNVTMTLTGEVEVHPMKASDELLLKSPDALISGKALESMIQSCVPGVSDVRALPYNDVDALLVAIRSVTYGEQMEIVDACPECEEEQTFEINLPFMLETMTFLEEEYEVKLADYMTVFLRPLTFAENALITKRMFEEAKKLQSDLASEDMSDDQKNAVNADAFNRMHSLNLDMLALSIEKVVTPDGTTTEYEHINDFVKNAPMSWFKAMEEKIREITLVGINKVKHVQCGACAHEWDTNVVFDPANFFKIIN